MRSVARGGSTVGSTQAGDVLEALRGLGADATALGLSVGLSERTLQDPDARVPTALVLALFERAGRQLRDPLVGLHAGARVQTRGALFYLVLSSPRLSEGLRLFERFARVALDTQRLSVAARGGVVELTIDPGDPAVADSHHGVDYLLGAHLGILRRAVPDLRLLGVDLSHAEVGEPGETARTFGCAVRFGCRRNVLRFSDALLDSVPAAANPAIAAQIEKLTAALLARVTAACAVDRVAAATRALVGRGRRADRAAVARELRLGERTLQRQLEAEAATFTRVRDGVLTELARALLANRALKVEAVALSVGFADVAAFSKAFRRWVGSSPTRYRERLARPRSLRLLPPANPRGGRRVRSDRAAATPQ